MLRIFGVEEARATVLRRTEWDDITVSGAAMERIEQIFGERIAPEEAVRRILKGVKTNGDTAVAEFAQKIDGVVTGKPMRVTADQIRKAYDIVPPAVVAALRKSAERVLAFHQKQVPQSWLTFDGGILGQKICPIDRVGCYVPGGSAPLASTLIMTAMVARAANVKEIVVSTPSERHTGEVAPITLVAADICGVTEVYSIGGAQAIAALAYGTQTIRRVDKIVGPGNVFVMLAKRQVFGIVGIDSLPGPTETVVIADESARADWIAADLMAQAEHLGGSAILLTNSRELAEKVNLEIIKQIPNLENASAIRESFNSRSGAVLTSSIEDAVALAEDYAPEHLCLSVKEPWQWLDRINRAGGVFLGEHSFEVLGDYVAGPSHTMPTGGNSRFASPCNVLDFVRVMSIISLSSSTAKELAPAAVTLAEAEGLSAHAWAATIRD